MSGYSRTSEKLSPYCPKYHSAVGIIGRRWAPEIIRALLAGKSRFSELTATIPGLSDRVLSQRLKALVSEGIAERRVEPSTPVRIEYHLTPKGSSLAGTVEALAAWADEWAPAKKAERAGRVR